MKASEFTSLLFKTGFKAVNIKRGNKLYIAFDFEENKHNFKSLNMYSSEIWFENFRYELTRYEIEVIKGNRYFIYKNLEG